jgi:arylsulfatase A-like enzyme
MTDNGQSGNQGTLNGKKVKTFKAGFKTGKGTPFEGGTHVPTFW